jgi:hypothetical protein
MHHGIEPVGDPVSHRNLTFDLYGSYRRGAMNTSGKLVVIHLRVDA